VADAPVDDFDAWVAARGPALVRLAWALTGSRSDAEDLVQDVLAKALPRWPRIAGLEDPDAYVRRMVVNGHVSRWRRLGRRERPVADVPDRPVASRDAAYDERERLWQACRSLPRDLRVAVVLRYFEQLEYAEIAALTGVREGSVRSRVSRGIATLRQMMGESSE
jgi:RNA polymerase sigma-70 factor (sigma-E family)